MIERGQERQHEGAGGTGRDDDAGGIDLDAVHRQIVAGDALPEVADTHGLGVAKLMAVQRALGRGNDGRRRGRARLSHFEMQNSFPGGRPLIGFPEHFHRIERRHIAAP